LIRHSISAALVAVALAGTSVGLPAPAEAKDGRNGALLGGLAVGAVGGVLLGQAIAGQQQAAPAPPPEPVYAEPEPVYQRPLPVVVDPSLRKAQRLREECDDGSRESCIRFGIIIGQNREREAQWRRQNPDMFAWDTN
jgi:hypothetical protein